MTRACGALPQRMACMRTFTAADLCAHAASRSWLRTAYAPRRAASLLQAHCRLTSRLDTLRYLREAHS